MGLLNDFVPEGVDLDSPLQMSRKNTPSVKIDLADDEQSIPAFSEEFLEEFDSDTDEGRLSRALQSWMTDYEIIPIFPKNKPSLEPMFNGNVGKNLVLRRSESLESVLTGISLFSCSECDIPTSASTNEDNSKRRRRRKVKSPARSARSSRTTSPSAPKESIWVELSTKRPGVGGTFDKLMQKQSVYTMDVYQCVDFESEAYQYFSEEEKSMLFNTAKFKGIKLVNKLKKSNSLSSITEDVVKRQRKRCPSAGSKSTGKPIDLEECRRQMINRKLAMLQKQNRSGTKFRRHLSSSHMSATSDISSDFIQDMPLSTRTVNTTTTKSEDLPAEHVSMWKGDREILEIDLEKGLTNKVMGKIQSTTTALARVTGHGETNALQTSTGKSDEFPKLTEEDFGYLPKIIQKIRVSPHLSDVIKEDIKVRMGRPRYHEICQRDLVMWNRGHALDRAHRNLKVFNWLQSLREDEFDNYEDLEIDDSISQNIADIAILHVESADDPDAKPLYLKEFKFNRSMLNKHPKKQTKLGTASQYSKISPKSAPVRAGK